MYQRYQSFPLAMWVSIINMKLRDEFTSLELFCDYYELNIDEVRDHLIKNGAKITPNRILWEESNS